MRRSLLGSLFGDQLAIPQVFSEKHPPARNSSPTIWTPSSRRRRKKSGVMLVVQEQTGCAAFEEDHEEAQSERDFIAPLALFDADGDGKLTEDEVMAAMIRKTGQGTTRRWRR